MDRITKSLLSEFQKLQALDSLDESEAFERFCCYAVISRELADTFNVEDVSTGGGSDGGIDGLAIIVNNVLVTSVEEIEEAARNRFLDVTFVFVQAKTTSGFNAGEIGTFTFGVKDFFAEKPMLKHNEFVLKTRELQAAIYDKSSLFTRGKATNSQTEVRREQLEALSEFQKKLEADFVTFEGKRRLYYERRSGQYAGEANVEKVRVITMIQLIRAFASMFLNEPHRVTRSYSSVLGGLGETIFGPSHQLKPYYVSAYAHYKLEFLFRNQQLAPRYKAARYHLLMAVARLAGGADRPAITANKMEKFCDPILDVLWDDKAALAIFQRAGALIDKVAGGKLDGDEVRTQPFTNKLLTEIDAAAPK